MHIIGFGRRAREAYPPNLAATGAATAALRNRNVAAPTTLASPFTPGGSSLIAAVVFTPRVSGILQLSATLALQNGVDPDTYGMVMETAEYTGLTVTGGSATSDGWVMGTTVPPVIGGVFVTSSPINQDERAVGANALSDLTAFGITAAPALPLGVPVAIVVLISGPGAHALAQVGFANLAVMELP